MTPTPLEPAPRDLVPGHVLLKREDVHELGAFKWRGALPTLEAYGAGAVVTASTGNHAAATGWAARRLGMRAIVFVPEEVSAAKLALIEAQGPEIRRGGRDFDETKEQARAWAEQEGIPFFEDGAEPAQLAGYGAIADEILDELEEPPAAVVVPVGNGALMNGIGAVFARRAPETRRVAVVAAAAPVMADSWEAGRVVDGKASETFADGLAVRVAIPSALELLREAATEMVRVSERQLAEAVAALDRVGIRAEASGAAPLAALRQLGGIDGTAVLVVTGRNIDEELLERARARPESFAART